MLPMTLLKVNKMWIQKNKRTEKKRPTERIEVWLMLTIYLLLLVLVFTIFHVHVSSFFSLSRCSTRTLMFSIHFFYLILTLFLHSSLQDWLFVCYTFCFVYCRVNENKKISYQIKRRVYLMTHDEDEWCVFLDAYLSLHN